MNLTATEWCPSAAWMRTEFPKFNAYNSIAAENVGTFCVMFPSQPTGNCNLMTFAYVICVILKSNCCVRAAPISAHLDIITLISHLFTHRPGFFISPPVRGCCFVGFLLCPFVFWASNVCTFSWTWTYLPVSGSELLHQWITKIILLSSVSIWVQFFISWVWQMYYETHCQPFFDLFPHKWVWKDFVFASSCDARTNLTFWLFFNDSLYVLLIILT